MKNKPPFVYRLESSTKLGRKHMEMTLRGLFLRKWISTEWNRRYRLHVTDVWKSSMLMLALFFTTVIFYLEVSVGKNKIF